jgi:chromosomal replication initiation ATPase DnaA
MNLVVPLFNEAANWETHIKSLKALRSDINSEKKRIEDRATAEEKFAKILQWIKKADDPEQTTEQIEEYVNQERYERSAEWFLGSTKFAAWSKAFQNPRNPDDSKHALWISGSYGTGKTTIV